jgi:hypothetical protein
MKRVLGADRTRFTFLIGDSRFTASAIREGTAAEEGSYRAVHDSE